MLGSITVEFCCIVVRQDLIMHATQLLQRWIGLAKRIKIYIDGLVQDCSNSIALAMELLQSCTKPSI